MDLKELSFDELKTLANGIEGFKYHPNIKEDKLRGNLNKYIEDNPECLGADGDENPASTEEIKAPVEDKKETENKKGLVEIKAVNARGEISSSFGIIDFGEDGIVEVESEVADHFCDKIPEGYNRC